VQLLVHIAEYLLQLYSKRGIPLEHSISKVFAFVGVVIVGVSQEVLQGRLKPTEGPFF
jgi:hypothetical protein